MLHLPAVLSITISFLAFSWVAAVTSAVANVNTTLTSLRKVYEAQPTNISSIPNPLHLSKTPQLSNAM